MSAARGNHAFLHDILTAINDIETAITGVDIAAFNSMRQTQHAVLFNLQVIGEAAKRLDPKLRARYPSVPWSKAIGMRNVIVHGYFALNLEMIWKTIVQDIPPFKAQIAAILDDMDRSSGEGD